MMILIRALGHLSLQLRLLEDAVDECATEAGLESLCIWVYQTADWYRKSIAAKMEALILAETLSGIEELPIVLSRARSVNRSCRGEFFRGNLWSAECGEDDCHGRYRASA